MKSLEDYKRKFSSDTLLLGIVIIIGAILRFYNYPNLPYSYDEFSALFRTRFDNFSDLIRYGVVETDTHPAGVQVFMYFWVGLFGENAMIVKLPFILCGIGAVYLGFKIAEAWFNPTVGLITAFFLSFSQYTITYSQYARPYSSGLFLALLFIWLFHKTFIDESKNFKWYFTGYILVGAANAYNHHFSLFFVGIAGVSNIFILKRKELLWYILANTLIFIVYIPHLQIFFTQLNKGGVESWLKKPTPLFFLDYLKYILHFSIAMYVTAGLLWILSMSALKRTFKKGNRFRLLILFWLLATYITSYIYSVERNAVLQYSVLIFVFPFAIMLVYSFAKIINNRVKYSMLLIVGFISIYTLIFEREHYRIQYKSVFREVMAETSDAISVYGEENVSVVNNFRTEINDFYAGDYNINAADIQRFDTLTSFIQFREKLVQRDNDYLAIGFVNISDLEFLSLARELYPLVLQKESYFTGDFYLLSRLPEDKKHVVDGNDENFSLQMNNREMFDYMISHDYQVLWENDLLRMPGWLGFTSFYESMLNDLVQGNKYQYVFVSFYVYDAQPEFESTMIFEVTDLENDSIIFLKSTRFGAFIPDSFGPYSVHQAIKLVDRNFGYADEKVSIYLQNKDEAYFYMDRFKITVTDGNPYIYSLLQDFPK